MLFPIPDPKNHPLPELPNTAKDDILGCLRAAKTHLHNGAPEHRGVCHICTAICATSSAQEVKKTCLTWVHAQVGKGSNLAVWLKSRGHVDTDRFQPRLQSARHAWLDEMIAYLEELIK